MAGLFDFLGAPGSDQSQALGLLAAGMMQGNFGGGLLAANQQFSPEAKMKRDLAQMQMSQTQLALAKAKREDTNEQGLAGLAQRFYTPGTPGSAGTGDVNAALPAQFQIGAQAPVAARPAGFDVKGYTGAALQSGYMNPLQAAQLQQAFAKDTQFNKIDPKDFTAASVHKFAQTGDYGDLVRQDKLHFAETGGAVAGLDPFTGRPVSSTPMTGSPYKDLILSDGNGGFVQNSPLIAAKKDIAKSGAANTNVKIENKMGESVAAQVGPMLKDSYTQANGAVGTIDAANRIIQAVDSGKLIAGPMANGRLKLTQIAQSLNIGGKDDAEIIANTRAAIRGLSEMTLQGRKQMSGQGQITEGEQALAERAVSGNIEDLTSAEIKQLANASARAARFVHAQHDQMLANLSSDPNTAGLAKFYKPMPMPSLSPIVNVPKSGAAKPAGGLKFLGFEDQ